MTIFEQLKIQAVGSLAVLIWSGVVSILILIILKKIIGIRISSEEEERGLDQSSHSERAYHN